MGDDAKFDEVISLYSGPRQTFSISNKDPIWNMIEQGDITEASKRFIKLTFSTPDIPLINRNVPQWIFTDIMLIPTNVTTHDILQGKSKLLNETTTEPTARTLTFVDSPFPTPEGQYAVSVRSSTNPLGEADSFGMGFTKSFVNGQKLRSYSKNSKDISSTQSLLKEMIDLTTQIDTNYDLADGRTGTKTIFSGDFFSFLTLNKSIRFMTELPATVVDKFNTGGYNGVSIIPCPVTATETTKISTARLKSTGTSMAHQQLNTKIPLTLGYYSPVFKDKVWGA